MTKRLSETAPVLDVNRSAFLDIGAYNEVVTLARLIAAIRTAHAEEINRLAGFLPATPSGALWDDIRVPAQNTKLNAAQSEPAFEGFIGGLFAYKFDTSNADDESVHFVVQIPHTYKEGTDIEPHVHWSPDSTNTGNVFWSFEYTVANIDGTFGATTTIDSLVAADGVALKHQQADFAFITGSSQLISAVLICRLTRKSASEATDTFTGNACFLEFDFHFEIDTLGSKTEEAK